MALVQPVSDQTMTEAEEKELGRKLHDEELRYEAWAEAMDEARESCNEEDD